VQATATQSLSDRYLQSFNRQDPSWLLTPAAVLAYVATYWLLRMIGEKLLACF